MKMPANIQSSMYWPRSGCTLRLSSTGSGWKIVRASRFSAQLWRPSLDIMLVSAERVLLRVMAVRILIVDDSAVFREGLRTMLEDHLDWQVCGEAENGRDAIKKNHLLVPQIIIMDLSMPSMTGLEAAREILKESPKIPILLLTLYLTHQLAEKARDAGIRATLSKTDMHQLISEIEALLCADDSKNGAKQSKMSRT